MNKKTGLVSFHLDVDFFEDEKIQFISARFGTKGEAITMRLLCKVYRQGYFTKWDEDVALLFSKGAGDNVSPACANEVVNELVKRGFFNKSLFDRFSILTSRRIQQQYFEASKRRKEAFYNPDYLLLDVSEWVNATPLPQLVSNSNQNVYILNENVDGLKQSKVKESKTKNIPPNPPLQGGQDESALKQRRKRELPAELKAELREIRDSYTFGDDLHKAVNDWIRYKFESNKPYKPTAFRNLLTRIKNISAKLGEAVVADVIRDSMANNYQGIVWDRLTRLATNINNGAEYKFDS